MRFFGRTSVTTLLTLTALAACSAAETDADAELDDEPGPDTSSLDLTIPRAEGPIEFQGACDEGETLSIAAVGDVLLHSALQIQAYSQGFNSLWHGVSGLVSRADLSYANLEGPTAAGIRAGGREATDPGLRFDKSVYTSYPEFNYHPSLVTGLRELGVDVVSTANNHALDRRAVGADKTIANLQAQNLAFTGTRSRSDLSAPWSVVTEKNGFKIGWVACSYSTNGIPDPNHQVLDCFKDTAELLTEISTLKTRVDAVIVTPHWGDEYVYKPNGAQKTLARRMIDAGALAVFGSHPHVVEPWEKIVAEDGHEGFVIYSLGNFVSGQTPMPRRATLVLYLGLTRKDGVTRINGVRYVPLTMRKWTVEPSDVAENARDTRNLVETMLGTGNEIPSASELPNPVGCVR